MTTPTTPEQARYAAVLIDKPTVYTGPEHRELAAKALRSLADQVEALTAELQIKNAECDLFQHCCDIRDAELDRLKQQEPVGYALPYSAFDGMVIRKRRLSSDSVALYLSAGAQPDAKELEELRADAERLDWMQSHMNYEFNTENDDGDLIFVCHKVTGYPNDREWHKVAEGRTLREVINAAKAAS